MYIRYSAFVLALVITLMASCAKEGPTGPTGPAGPVFYGTISGHVSLYDMYGSKVLTNLNKVTVNISSSSIPASVDANGLYQFINVTTGTYAIAASDSGYGFTTYNSVNFISGTLYRDIQLSAIPDSFITGFTPSHSAGSLFDSLLITVVPDTRDRNCIIFVGGGSNVSNNPSLYLTHYKVAVPANKTSVSLAIPQQDLLDVGLASGATVYFAAYSYVINDVSVYSDPSTGNNFYYAVNATPLLSSTIVP